ncbi:MAG: hypothetical protein QOH35_5729, partial [Acidobacteriaceae bacterium]|nr:hypothetical protein [Acidobacteriaceae bacterium]
RFRRRPDGDVPDGCTFTNFTFFVSSFNATLKFADFTGSKIIVDDGEV